MSPYAISADQRKHLDNRYTHHPPTSESQTERYMLIRERCRDMAILICENVPDCRERATALTKLDEVMFFANAGIARTENRH